MWSVRYSARVARVLHTAAVTAARRKRDEAVAKARAECTAAVRAADVAYLEHRRSAHEVLRQQAALS